MFEKEKKEIPKEPEDIFTEAKVEEKPIERVEPTEMAIPREFIREKKGFPKILLPIIILLILAGTGFLLVSAGVIRFEKKTEPLVNQPIVTPPISPAGQPPILDSDGDGLTDEEEMALRTNLNSVDTDNDGLTDKEETKIYQTDPFNPDTDGDGYQDGEETLNGYNPKDPTPGAKLFDLQAEIEKLEE